MSYIAPITADRPARASPHRRLVRQLLALAGEDSSVAAASVEPWASMTFEGRRHLIDIGLSGADAQARAEAMRGVLSETEFALGGHIVADITADDMRLGADANGDPYVLLRLSVLTIEDW